MKFAATRGVNVADDQATAGADRNPWQPPEADFHARPAAVSRPVPLVCPECGAGMRPGYLTTGSWLYWRRWNDRSLLVRFSDRVRGTLPSFVGTNRLPGYRCEQCEVIVFRYGDHRHEWHDAE